MDDPILRAAVSFTRHHFSLIAALTVLSVVAGLAVGLYLPRGIEQRAVILTATTAKEGPIETLSVLSLRLEELIEDRVQTGYLPDDVELEARPMVGQPPNQEDTNLIELIVKAPSPEPALEVLRLIEETVVESQSPVMREEHERLRQHVAAIDSNIARLEKQRVTPESNAVYMQLIREVVDTGRMATPTRAYEPKMLSVYRPARRSLLRALGLPILLGLLGGLGLGYGAAFFQAARSSPRISTSNGMS